jgi:hypothetical protein
LPEIAYCRHACPPTTSEGIEPYLGSGLLKGIGLILAKKLVGRFGAEVLAVIENRAAELQTVVATELAVPSHRRSR